MPDKTEVTPKQVPPLRLKAGWIEMSTQTSHRFAKYFPYPWVIWVIGWISTWTVFVSTALLNIWISPTNFSDVCSRYSATCSNQCGNDYFFLLLVTAHSVALVGVLFQVLIILRHWSRMKIASALGMFAIWGMFFSIVYLGNAVVVDLDAATWTYCLSPLWSAIGTIAGNTVLYVLPLLIALLIALTVTYRLWPSTRPKSDTSIR